MENERIAVLETKVDALIECVNSLKKDIQAITAVYRAGKYVLSFSAFFAGWLNWDAILLLLHPPKH